MLAEPGFSAQWKFLTEDKMGGEEYNRKSWEGYPWKMFEQVIGVNIQ